MATNEDKIGDNLVSMGHDVTGQGIPNLVISDWSGGGRTAAFLLTSMKLEITFER